MDSDVILIILFGFIACLLTLALIYILKHLSFILKYNKSKYLKESNVGLLKCLFNPGYYGEALIFFELEKIPVYSKIMTNLYIPAEDGTTEIDVVLISSFGVYVIESKNYGGWVFGSDDDKYWTNINRRRKHKIFNPILQNRHHIKYLGKILNNVELNSLIIFGNRCELKKIHMSKNMVMKLEALYNTLSWKFNNTIYSNEQIDNIYNLLKPYSNKTAKEKQEHIDYLNDKRHYKK